MRIDTLIEVFNKTQGHVQTRPCFFFLKKKITLAVNSNKYVL